MMVGTHRPIIVLNLITTQMRCLARPTLSIKLCSHVCPEGAGIQGAIQNLKNKKMHKRIYNTLLEV
jgi:hypothetical protein